MTMAEIETYREARQEGIDEAAKRIESFKNRTVLQMRLGGIQILDEQYELICKLVDAELKLVFMK